MNKLRMEILPASDKRSFITFGKPDIGFAEKDAVLEVLESGWLSTGIQAKSFEEEFSSVTGGYPTVAVSSCTDGLVLALMALGIGEGDEVITTPLTFAATVNAILAVKAKPVFIDVNKTGHLDPDLIDVVLTNRTKAIIPVHYTGLLCDMPAISEIAKLNGLKVIEDAAHSFGVYFGSLLSDAACYSFYPNKNITSGEGGMVVCKDQALADRVRLLSMQGLSKDSHLRYTEKFVSHYSVQEIGIKANLSDIHAALGRAQLRRWPELERKRNAVWKIYEEAFGVKEKPHSHHIYSILRRNRNSLRYRLFNDGVGTGIHFNPLHLEPAYQFLGYKQDDFPQAEMIGEMTLSLPISPTMTEEDAHYVVESVKKNQGDL